MYFQDYLLAVEDRVPAAKRLMNLVRRQKSPLAGWAECSDVEAFLAIHGDKLIKQEFDKLWWRYQGWKDHIGHTNFELRFESAFVELPFAFTKLEAFSDHVWMPLNRSSRPLGTGLEDLGDVDLYQHLGRAVRFKRDPRSFNCWAHGSHNAKTTQLFLGESGLATQTYFSRLTRLLAHSNRPLTPLEIQDALNRHNAEEAENA